MALTPTEAAKQLAEEIKKQGGFKIGNVMDGVIGFGERNVNELQEMLNKVLAQKGVLTPADEQAIEQLLKKEKEAREKRKKIRTRIVLVACAITTLVGAAIYFSIKKQK